MTEWITGHYDLLRALHLIAVIAWMAGLMYLPRLFVYHSLAPVGSERDEVFQVMERRLYRGIMVPSMIVVWALGLVLIVSRGGLDFVVENTWFHVKLAMVVAITGNQMLYGRWLRQFANGQRPLNHVVFRFLNELPFVLMIVAVLMVVLEPR
jgi:putative membrane protein